MIFTDNRYEQVLRGQKTQTRRMMKEMEMGIGYDGRLCVQYSSGICLALPAYIDEQTVAYYKIYAIGHDTGRVKWELGKTYAVQPKRAAKSGGRIKITRLGYELAGDISEADAIAEGFETPQQFVECIMQIYNLTEGQARNTWMWVIEFELLEVYG